MKSRISFILFLFCPFLFADGGFDIRYLTNNEGLSNSSINCIFQDSDEILWFGSWDGLNIYNGKEFKVYKPEPGNPLSISNNVIRDIVETASGLYWISTDMGINRFDLREGSFKRYFTDSLKSEITNEHSFLIAADSGGRLVASVYRQGLYFYDDHNDKFLQLNIGDRLNIKNILFDNSDQLWIHTDERELLRLSFNGDSANGVVRDVEAFELLKVVESFFNGGAAGLFMQAADRAIYRYDIERESIIRYNFNYPDIGMVRDISCVDSLLYLGSEKGLYRYDLKLGEMEAIIENNSILSLTAGSQGILWVGTDNRGIGRIVPTREKFVTYSPLNLPGFGRSAVRAFCEDGAGSLFVGTKGKGLYRFEREKRGGRLELKDRYDSDDGLVSNSIYTVVSDQDGTIWIGSDGNSINYIVGSSENIYQLAFSGDQEKKSLSSIYAILADGENRLWVGTSGYGMYRLKIDKSSHPYRIIDYKQYIYSDGENSISNNIVYSILGDGDNLLIATRGGGVNRFNIDKETFEVIGPSEYDGEYSSSSDVLCLHNDNRGNIWAGTSMGLFRLSYDSFGNILSSGYNEMNGMPNNTIHGILQDRLDNIWVSTNRGLAKLSCHGDSLNITSYFSMDGLQDNEFSDGAYYASSGGSLFYFGGINGFNEFNPLEVIDETNIPKLMLDAFYVDNRRCNIGQFLVERGGREVLTLSYDQSSVSLHFVNLDYLAGEKCEISYMLEGHQSDWVNIGRSNTIVFTNLPKGNYLLKVKNSNAYGVWSKNFFTLPFKVNPPWWETGFAYTIYSLILVLIAFAVWKIVSYRLRVRENNRIIELEKQQTEQIHQAKLSFFTNIAHEFSNSLTLIYSPCEKLLRERQSDSLIRKYLQIIKANSERMQNLIQQLIEFRKAEGGHLKLTEEIVDIPEMIRYIVDSFLDMLEEKKIECELIFQPEDIQWITDSSSLEKILFNLISNAVKYTPLDERIEIRVEIIDGLLTISVTNRGVGISEEYHEHIFDRFEVLNRFEKQASFTMQSRHGIGLAICKSLTEVLGGDIAVDSDGESYASFILKLPQLSVGDSVETDEVGKSEPTVTGRERDGSHDIKADGDQYKDDSGSKKKKGERELILIVEDDLQIREMIKELLNEKYEIVEASNGMEAIEITNQQLPRIIISDIIMPVMDGVEMVKKIRSNSRTSHIPIIFLSSKSDIESQIEGYETGVDAYLGKPFNVRHLEALIESLLIRMKRMRDYSDSPVSVMEHFEGRLIDREDKELLMRINTVLQDNIDNENLSIGFIANEVAVSRMQLYRKIKEITGLTPTEYIRSLRLKYAEKLLRTTNRTVQEIIYLSGFNNKGYFYRVFARKHNKTPVEYRNSAE